MPEKRKIGCLGRPRLSWTVRQSAPQEWPLKSDTPPPRRPQGTPPPEREIGGAVGHLPCAASMPMRTRNFTIAKDGGLGDVLVRIKSRSGNPLPTFPPPGQPVVERIGCQFHPRVIAVMTNQPLIIRNSDPVIQNVLATGKLNPGFNVTQTRIGQEDSRRFAVPVGLLR